MKKLIMVLLFCLSFTTVAQEPGMAENTVEWPESYYAPYVYMARYPVFQLAQVAETEGVRFFTLAFVLGGTDCNAAWSGVVPLDSSYIYSFMQRDLPALRALGGDIIVSFGGAGGAELAQVCADAETLAAEYQRVIDIYGVTHLDFDIEGDDIREPEAIARRSEAIVLLEENNEQDLVITYTLPVLPTGLTEEGIAVLESAIEYGVEIDIVNIMTMNFGPDFEDKTMGENNVLAAQSLFEQLQTLYPEKEEAELWAMIGLTPMFGINDRAGDIFDLDDAALVRDFAQEQGITLLAAWSLDRDQPCEYVDALANDCSGTPQEPYAFSDLLNTITGE